MTTEAIALRRSRADLERELGGAGVTFKGKSCNCPFHEDRHASAGIYEDATGVWRFKCQVPTCDVGGDIYDIRAKLSGRSVADVLRSESGHETPEKRMPPKRIFQSVEAIRESISHIGNVEACYIYSDPTTGAPQTVQVRYKPTSEDRKKFLTHHAVPGGFVLGAPPKPWPLYNRARTTSSKTVVVVEGEKCVHALHSIGIVATTSLSGAANGDKADWSPLAGKKVTIWPDFDESGEKYAQTVIAMLESLSPRPEIHLIDPRGLGLDKGGDVADLIGDGATAEEIRAILSDGAEPVGAHSDLAKRIDGIVSGKWQSLSFPGAPRLTAAAKALFPGTTTVICADPAASKSMLLLEWSYLWHRDGVPVALMELEEDRAFHLMRLLAIVAGGWQVLDDAWGRSNPELLRSLHEQHRDALDSFAPSLHAAPMGQLNYGGLLTWIETQCKAGAKIIGIDPITAVHTGDSRQIEDLTFIVKASAILRDHSARMILVTHPRMGSGRRGAGTSQDDLAGGRAFSRHTQTVLWLHRHDPAKRFTCATGMGNMPLVCNRSIYIAKARNGPGHGTRVGFNLGPDARFTEHGNIVSETDAEVSE